MEYSFARVFIDYLLKRAEDDNCNKEYYRALTNAADSLRALLKFWWNECRSRSVASSVTQCAT